MVESCAGHLSARMKDRYAHVRIEAKRMGLLTLVNPSVGVVPAGEKPLTNQDVPDMVASGFDSALIVAKIAKSTCAFDISVDTLKRLKIAGVPQPVIAAMVKR